MTVNAVNNSMRQPGLCPTLCIFGVIPRPSRNNFAASKADKSRAIGQAMNKKQKYHNHQKINLGLRYKCPFGNGQSDLRRLSYGKKFLVERQGTRKWEGLFKFINMESETVCLQLHYEREIFRSHMVSPYRSPRNVTAFAEQMNTTYRSPNVFYSESVAYVSQLGRTLFPKTIFTNVFHFNATENHKYDNFQKKRN